MKRSSDSLQKSTIDPELLPEQHHKKRRTFDCHHSKKSSHPKPFNTTIQDKKSSPILPSNQSPNDSKDHSSSTNSIDRFLNGLFQINDLPTKPKPIRHNWEIVKDLTKTYEAMQANEPDDQAKNSVTLKYNQAYHRKRDRVKETKAEENKGSEDLLLKKIESITTGESGSEYEKPSVSRIRAFNTQSYSTDLGSEYPKEPTYQEIRRPKQKIPSKKRNPSENKWIKSMEPIDPSKPLDHTNAKAWVPELPKRDKSSSERTSSQRSRRKNKKKSKERRSGSVSIERSRKEAIKDVGESMIDHVIKKEPPKKEVNCGLIEEYKQREYDFMMKIEELSRSKAYWEEVAQKNESFFMELKQENSMKESAIEELRRELIRSEAYRSELHNHIHELRGNLRIFCRVKPFEGPSTVTYPEKSSNVAISKLKSVEINAQGKGKILYHFDRVFDQETTQSQIFEEINPFVQSAIDGHQVCILAYGQTGSGKTFTMEGPNLSTANAIFPESGILPRSVQFIFEEIRRQSHKGVNISLELACLEIYNDSLTDLLAEVVKKQSEESPKGKESPNLSIVYINGKVNVHNLTWKKINDFNQLLALISQASKSRAVQKTSWNEKSSRSHCIYRLRLIHSDGKEGLLNIVDLAGSERADPKGFNDKSAKEVNRFLEILK